VCIKTGLHVLERWVEFLELFQLYLNGITLQKRFFYKKYFRLLQSMLSCTARVDKCCVCSANSNLSLFKRLMQHFCVCTLVDNRINIIVNVLWRWANTFYKKDRTNNNWHPLFCTCNMVTGCCCQAFVLCSVKNGMSLNIPWNLFSLQWCKHVFPTTHDLGR